MAITWSAQYVTGVTQIDKQHETIINQFNELSDKMRMGKGKEEVGKAIEFLDEYTKKHFADEEKFMDQTQCGLIEINKQQHAVFIKKIADFKKRYEENPDDATLVLNVHSDLSDWFINHIMKIDLKLKGCDK